MQLRNYWLKCYGAGLLTGESLSIGATDAEKAAATFLRCNPFADEARVFDRETGELLATARRRGKGRLWNTIDTWPGPVVESPRKEGSTMKNLKRIREAAGLSQTQLALAAGVPVRNVRAYEAEAGSAARDINRAEAVVVYRLAQALRCDVADLLELPELADV